MAAILPPLYQSWKDGSRLNGLLANQPADSAQPIHAKDFNSRINVDRLNQPLQSPGDYRIASNAAYNQHEIHPSVFAQEYMPDRSHHPISNVGLFSTQDHYDGPIGSVQAAVVANALSSIAGSFSGNATINSFYICIENGSKKRVSEWSGVSPLSAPISDWGPKLVSAIAQHGGVTQHVTIELNASVSDVVRVQLNEVANACASLGGKNLYKQPAVQKPIEFPLPLIPAKTKLTPLVPSAKGLQKLQPPIDEKHDPKLPPASGGTSWQEIVFLTIGVGAVIVFLAQ